MSQSVKDKKLQEVINYYVAKGEQEACSHFGLTGETIKRYLREARVRGITSEEFNPVVKAPKVLVLDIETSLMEFYGWSPGKQYVGPSQIKTDWYTHGWAVKWLFDPKVYSGIQTSEESLARDDERIIREIWEFLDHADIVIIHNARFDVRKLNARFIYYRLPPPSPYKVVDTLLVMRKEALFSSNKQDELCRKLGLTRKVEHEGYDLWKKCFNGDPMALVKMNEYNEGDIMGLEELYVVIRPYIKSHPNMALYVEGDGYICPNCGSDNLKMMDHTYDTNMNRFSSFRCECGAIGRAPVSKLSKEQKPKLVSVAK